MPGKLRWRGGISASLLSGSSVSGALPKVQLVVDEVSCGALVDTGCTKGIVHVSMCFRWTRKDMCVTTVSGERYSCQGTSVVRVQLPSGVHAFVEVLVVSTRPLNFNFILGMNGVRAFRGVTVRTPSDVQFGVDECISSAPADNVATDYVIDEKDFTVTYDVAAKEWILSWKWCDGQEPACLLNTTSEYQIQPDPLKNMNEKCLSGLRMIGLFHTMKDVTDQRKKPFL